MSPDTYMGLFGLAVCLAPFALIKYCRHRRAEYYRRKAWETVLRKN